MSYSKIRYAKLFFSLQILEWWRITGKLGSDEMLVKEIPEFLSLSRDNRTLTFHPFSSSDYMSSIHANVYKCIAKNKAGIIASPAIDLRAGILRWFTLTTSAFLGLKCDLQENLVLFLFLSFSG